MINVYHQEEGVVFRKLEAETGISYVAIPIDEVKEEPIKGLLVRHGNPFTGRCGYYPLSLLMATPEKRRETAIKVNKRIPNEEWIRKMLDQLELSGLRILH